MIDVMKYKSLIRTHVNYNSFYIDIRPIFHILQMSET